MLATKKGVLFCALTFALGWTPLAIAWLAGARDFKQAGAASLIFLLSPALSAILCALMLDRGSRSAVLALRPRLNAWWLLALAAPVLLAPAAIGAALAFSPYAYVGLAEAARKAQAAPGGVADLKALRLPGLLLANLVSSAIFAVPEELGWRGYLHAQWRRVGFWRASWAIGLIWSAWHWPAMIFFGLNTAPGHAATSLLLFTLLTLLLSPLMTLMRDRGRSIWPPVLLHASFNTVAPLTLSFWRTPDFPWAQLAMGSVPALGAIIIAIFYRHPDRELSARTA